MRPRGQESFYSLDRLNVAALQELVASGDLCAAVEEHADVALGLGVDAGEVTYMNVGEPISPCPRLPRQAVRMALAALGEPYVSEMAERAELASGPGSI